MDAPPPETVDDLRRVGPRATPGDPGGEETLVDLSGESPQFTGRVALAIEDERFGLHRLRFRSGPWPGRTRAVHALPRRGPAAATPSALARMRM